MPTIKRTLDSHTFEEYLELIRQRGYRLDADDLWRSIPAELGIPYAKLSGETMESIQGRLIRLRGDLIAEAVGPLLINAGDEALIGAGVSAEYAAKVMAKQNMGWMQFKRDNSPR